MPKIGLMISATDANDVWYDYIEAFKGAIKTAAPIYEYQPPHGARGVDYDTYYAAAQQLITDGANVIVTAGNLAARACKDATKTQLVPTPIVVASAGDLAGLAGGNLTGFTNGQDDLAIVKIRIGIMSQLNPTEVGIVGNASVPPVSAAMNDALGLIPQLHKVQAHLLPIGEQDLRDVPTIRTKLSSLAANVDVLYVCSDPLMRTHGHDFVTAAHGGARQFMTMHEFAEWNTKHGGDLCYGPDFQQLFIKAAGYVDQILDDVPIANLPVVPVTHADCHRTP